MADLSPYFTTAGGGQQIDPLFLQAQATVESRLNPNAVSPKGAIGVSQIMPQTATTLGVHGTPMNPRDPDQAIGAQAALMNSLLKKYGDDARTALLEYHGGPDRRLWGPKTNAYPDLVFAEYQKLKAAQENKPVPETPSTLEEHLRQKEAQERNPATTPTVPSTLERHLTEKEEQEKKQPPPPAGSSHGTKDFGPEPPTQPWEQRMIPQPPTPGANSSVPLTPSPIDMIKLAAQRGWQYAPTMVTPQVQNILEGRFGWPAIALLHGGNAVLGGVSAGYNALQEGVTQTLDPVGTALTGQPGLGRDVATALDLIPALGWERRIAAAGRNKVSNAGLNDQMRQMAQDEQQAVTRFQQQQTTPTTPTTKAISDRAYQLWDQAGRPEGRDTEFWGRAEEQINAENKSATPPTAPSTPASDALVGGFKYPTNSWRSEKPPTADPNDPATRAYAQQAITVALATNHPIAYLYAAAKTKFGKHIADAVWESMKGILNNPLSAGSTISRNEQQPEQAPESQ